MRLSLRTVPPAPTATPHGRGPAWGASRTRAGSTLAEAEPSPPTGRLRATAQPVTSHAGPEEADAADIPGHSRTSRWAICFLKNCALLLSEQPLIRVIYKEPGARVALERGRVEMDGPAQRGAHPGSEDAAPRCAGELGRGSRRGAAGRRLWPPPCGSGGERRGQPPPALCVRGLVLLGPRGLGTGRARWPGRVRRGGDARAAVCRGSSCRADRRARPAPTASWGPAAPRRGHGGSPPPRHVGQRPGGGPGELPPPTLSRLISLTFRGELQTRTAPLGKGQGGFSYFCLKMVCVER